MKKLLLLLLLYCLPCAPQAWAADAPDREAVIARVQAFFDAMTERDLDAMRDLLTDDGILYGYRETPDGLRLARIPHRDYIDGLGSGRARLVERFWQPQVLLHDRMAVVWTPYDLYVDGAFSHCGIDSFSFLKTEAGWKIAGIVFSMETDGCEPGPLGPLEERP